MQGLDHLLERAKSKRARDQRLAAVRAMIDDLAPDEKEELLVGYLADMGTAETPEPPPEPPSVMSIGERAAQQAMALRAGHAPLRVGDAVLLVMRDGIARATGEIRKAVGERFPAVNTNSIPAAVARLVSEIEPPLLVKRGKNERGDALYVIAPATQEGE